MNTIIDIINAVADRMEGWDPSPMRVITVLLVVILVVPLIQSIAWAVR